MIPIDWWFIFPMPDSSLEFLNWDASILYNYWSFIIIGLFIIVLGVNIWFYFFTLPKPDALKKYWRRKLIFCLLFIFLALILLLTKSSLLAGEFQVFDIWRLFYLIFILLLDYLEMELFLYLIFLFVSLFPIRWHLVAMRRYPFYFKNIN